MGKPQALQPGWLQEGSGRAHQGQVGLQPGGCGESRPMPRGGETQGSERTKGPIGALAPRGVSVPSGHIVFLRIASNLGLNVGFDLFVGFFSKSDNGF